jgi:hypothetical protein
MARSAALKLIAGDGDDGDEDEGKVDDRVGDSAEEPSLFVSTLIRRGSVAAPAE